MHAIILVPQHQSRPDPTRPTAILEHRAQRMNRTATRNQLKSWRPREALAPLALLAPVSLFLTPGLEPFREGTHDEHINRIFSHHGVLLQHLRPAPIIPPEPSQIFAKLDAESERGIKASNDPRRFRDLGRRRGSIAIS